MVNFCQNKPKRALLIKMQAGVSFNNELNQFLVKFYSAFKALLINKLFKTQIQFNRFRGYNI